MTGGRSTTVAGLPLVHALEDALDRWWARWVPVVFPGYALARLVTADWPWTWAAAATSVLTFSAAGLVPSLSAVRRQEITLLEGERCWVWANLNNPWLDAASLRVWLSATLATLLTGWTAGYTLRGRYTPRLAPDFTDWSGWAGEAMNWAAVLGLVALVVTAMARVGGRWGALLDPLVVPVPNPILHAGLLDFGGGLLLVPELLIARSTGLPWMRLVGWRLLQAASAALLAAALPM